MCYFICRDMSQCEVTINFSFYQKMISKLSKVELNGILIKIYPIVVKQQLSVRTVQLVAR